MNLTARIEISGPLLAGKGPAVVQKHIDRFVTSGVMMLTREVKVRTPQGVSGAQGGLLASIQPEVTGRGTPLVRGSVGTASRYGEVVERGRRPGRGWPPRGALVPWIQLKFGLSEREAQRIEYVVRRKIAQKGFEGAHMFEKAFTENLSRLQEMAQREGLAIVVEISDGK